MGIESGNSAKSGEGEAYDGEMDVWRVVLIESDLRIYTVM